MDVDFFVAFFLNTSFGNKRRFGGCKMKSFLDLCFFVSPISEHVPRFTGGFVGNTASD